MGGYHQLPVTPFNPPDPMEQFSRAMALKNMLQNAPLQHEALQQQVQAGAQENQMRELQMQDQQRVRQAFMDAQGDPDKTVDLASKAGVNPQLVIGLRNSFLEQKQKLATLTKDQLDNQKKIVDMSEASAQRVLTAKPEDQPGVYANERQQLLQSGLFSPEQIPEQYPGADFVRLHATAANAARKQIADVEEAQAKAAQTTAGTNIPLDTKALNDWLAKPENKGKGASDFLLWKLQHSPSAIMMGGANLSPQALQLAAQLYAQTGQLPGGFTRSPQTTAAVIETAAKNAPGTDIAGNKIQYQSKMALERDFKVGNAARNIRSLNTAIGHLGQLYEAGQALPKNDLQAMNRLANYYHVQTGQSAPIVYRAIASAVAGEVATTLKSAAGTDPEIDRILSTIGTDQSPEQRTGAAKAFVGILGSRLHALEEQYTQGAGHAPTFRVLYPGSERVLNSMGVNIRAGEGQAGGAKPDAKGRPPLSSFER